MDDAVELLAATRRKQELSCRHVLIRKFDGGEMPFAVRRQAPVDQQAAAAILEVIALVLEIGDAFISWADVLDLIANVLRISPTERLFGAYRVELASN